MDPITIVTLAFTKVFETTIEKFTETALTKVDQLRNKLWDKLRGNPEAEAALQAVENGSNADIEKVAAYLQVEMNEDDSFAQEIKGLAREIQNNINTNQGENWNVFGGEVNYTKENQAPVIQGGSGHKIEINYNQH